MTDLWKQKDCPIAFHNWTFQVCLGFVADMISKLIYIQFIEDKGQKNRHSKCSYNIRAKIQTPHYQKQQTKCKQRTQQRSNTAGKGRYLPSIGHDVTMLNVEDVLVKQIVEHEVAARYRWSTTAELVFPFPQLHTIGRGTFYLFLTHFLPVCREDRPVRLNLHNGSKLGKNIGIFMERLTTLDWILWSLTIRSPTNLSSAFMERLITQGWIPWSSTIRSPTNLSNPISKCRLRKMHLVRQA